MTIKRAAMISAAAILLSGCSLTRAGIDEKPQTGLTEDGDLLIVYDSAGVNSEYLLKGDQVVAEDTEYDPGDHIEYSSKLFKPTAEGECSIIFRTRKQQTDRIEETQVFDITVNEQLEMTYDSHTTDLLPVYDLLSSSDSVTVTRDGVFSFYGADNTTLIVAETSLLFGSWSYCTSEEADVADMSCVSVDYTGLQGLQYRFEFWFGDGDTAYGCRSNENGLEEWQVYTLDPVSSFEYLNTLLEILDGMSY